MRWPPSAALLALLRLPPSRQEKFYGGAYGEAFDEPMTRFEIIHRDEQTNMQLIPF
jgi:hypothetical protein